MYKIIPWSDDLDLEQFYKDAASRGFDNNASQHMLVDCFKKEQKCQTWILYYNNKPVGSVAAHTFDDVMGPNTFRVAARTCVFTDKLPLTSLRTRNQIITHQHVTGQFLIPACLEWLPNNARAFITSNENKAGTQKIVHRVFAPAMEKTGQMKRIKEVFYRGTTQTVWEIFSDKFFEQLNKYPRW
jgi:hypothetical protein